LIDEVESTESISIPLVKLAAAALAARRPPSILIDVSDALFISRKKVIFFRIEILLLFFTEMNRWFRKFGRFSDAVQTVSCSTAVDSENVKLRHL